MVEAPLALHDMEQRESEGGIGTGQQLQMEVGDPAPCRVAHGIDDDAEGLRLLEPMLVGAWGALANRLMPEGKSAGRRP